MTSPRAGWYPDPAGTPETFRWWTGSEWTSDTSSSAHAASPRPRFDDFPAGAASGRAAGRPLRLGLVLAVGFVLLATAAVALAERPGASRTATEAAGPSSPSPAALSTTPQGATATRNAPDSAPTGHVDLGSGVATIGPATMTLPGEPYEVEPASLAVRGLFDVFFVANAPVHRGYDGSNDWSATVGLAHIPPSLVAGADVDDTATMALHQIGARFFGGYRTTAHDLRTSDTTVDGRAACSATVAMAYSVRHLPSTHDLVHVVLVRQDDGSVIAAVSSVPADAAPGLHDQAADALRSLTFS